MKQTYNAAKSFRQTKKALVKLIQLETVEKAGVGLRFLRDLEQRTETLRLDKVNQVLQLFGYKVGPVKMKAADE